MVLRWTETVSKRTRMARTHLATWGLEPASLVSDSGQQTCYEAMLYLDHHVSPKKDLNMSCQKIASNKRFQLQTRNKECQLQTRGSFQLQTWSANSKQGVPTPNKGCQLQTRGANSKQRVPTPNKGCQLQTRGANSKQGVPTPNKECQLQTRGAN